MKWNGNTYEITQACGHVITIITKDEEIANEIMKTTCDKCKIIASFNRDKGLITLIGSPAQVRWANEIRKDRFKALDFVFQKNKQKGHTISDEFQFVYDALKGVVEASFYIDSRDNNIEVFFMNYVKHLAENPIINTDERMAVEEVIMKPENQTEIIPAEINIQTYGVSVFYRKNERMNELLKRLEYRWDRGSKSWLKESSDPLDRAAEVGVRILQLGIPVVIHNEEVREKILDGNFVVENFKKIRYKDGRFLIRCSNEFIGTQLVGHLGATKIKDDVYSVRSIYAIDLRDFASEHNYEYTEEASVFMEQLPERKEIIVENNLLEDLLEDDL